MNIDQYLGGTITILHANNIISEMRFTTLTLKVFGTKLNDRSNNIYECRWF